MCNISVLTEQQHCEHGADTLTPAGRFAELQVKEKVERLRQTDLEQKHELWCEWCQKLWFKLYIKYFFLHVYSPTDLHKTPTIHLSWQPVSQNQVPGPGPGSEEYVSLSAVSNPHNRLQSWVETLNRTVCWLMSSKYSESPVSDRVLVLVWTHLINWEW